MKREKVKVGNVYEKTDVGQKVYDVYFSRLSAAEVSRRHPELSRAWILAQRKAHPEDRKKPLAKRERGDEK